jgi:hypothetical protein
MYEYIFYVVEDALTLGYVSFRIPSKIWSRATEGVIKLQTKVLELVSRGFLAPALVKCEVMENVYVCYSLNVLEEMPL